MKPSSQPGNSTTLPSKKCLGRGWKAVFVTGVCAVSIAAAYWAHQRAGTTASTGAGSGAPQSLTLSAGTVSVLKGLEAPIEIRFYSPLGQADVPTSVAAFAARIDELLSAYERVADGKVTVVRGNPVSDSKVKADAQSDGIRPVHFGEGEVYYLGLTVAHDRQKESIAQLSPDWEAAVEPDLSRTIARLANTKASVNFADSSEPAIAVAEEAVRSNPRLTAVSVDEGTRILREAALAEFKAAAAEMELKTSQAQQRFAQAQNGSVDAERDAARQQLDQAQSERTEKLKEIAARLQYQIAAFERSKGITHTAAR